MKKLSVVSLILAAVMFIASGCTLFDIPYNPIWDYDYSEMALVQLEPPYEGQPLIKVYTSFGEFDAMLFPIYAPNTVANFIARIEDGFYLNKPVLSLINDEYFLTGALNEEITQGMTNDGKLIPNEYSVNLWPFKGSMLAISGRQGYGDSRFIVIGGFPLDEESAEAMSNTVGRDGTKLFPDELMEAFNDNESIPGIIGMYTIFGQITDGFDVLDELLSAETDDTTKRPIEEILIEKIELSYYKS
ncbi:MAG: peptidylprolyl isomerase [Oscillospiraceae bacterium]|nr:peptidylprolyl isomerase [Oscillospiraceae bacterium]